MNVLFACIIGYVLGSVPFALLIGKTFYRTDIRTAGSRNLGGSNAGRVLIIWRHRGNLIRIARGEERKISWM